MFDSAALVDFPGDTTDFFGFGETNLITLSGSAPFTATLETLNWANLTSVRFSTTNDSARDNIVINQVPEPASLALLGIAALTVGARRFRRR